MSDISNFESRSGRLNCNAEDVFAFVTDLRNFERFIPGGTINNWSADKESCNFSVSMIGTVTVRLAEKERYTRVVYTGDALKKNDFTLTLLISDKLENPAEVSVHLSADLNPMMKMMAAKPIKQFLEMLINEMEGFNDWKNIKE
jgi:carbon monoxide dehydrogenase subunit G